MQTAEAIVSSSEYSVCVCIGIHVKWDLPDGLSLLNEDDRLRVFFPRNSFQLLNLSLTPRSHILILQ